MTDVRLTVHFEKAGGDWWADSPDTPGFYVAAFDLAELQHRARRALVDILAETGDELGRLVVELVSDHDEMALAGAGTWQTQHGNWYYNTGYFNSGFYNTGNATVRTFVGGALVPPEPEPSREQLLQWMEEGEPAWLVRNRWLILLLRVRAWVRRSWRARRT